MTQFGAGVASSGSLAPTHLQLSVRRQQVYQGHTLVPILPTLSSLSSPSLRDVISLPIMVLLRKGCARLQLGVSLDLATSPLLPLVFLHISVSLTHLSVYISLAHLLF